MGRHIPHPVMRTPRSGSCFAASGTSHRSPVPTLRQSQIEKSPPPRNPERAGIRRPNPVAQAQPRLLLLLWRLRDHQPTMGGAAIFPSEDLSSSHPDDAWHWATCYAELVRSLPRELRGTEVALTFAGRLELWEDRLRALQSDAPDLVSAYYRDRPARVRALPRPGMRPFAGRRGSLLGSRRLRVSAGRGPFNRSSHPDLRPEVIADLPIPGPSVG